MLDPEIKTILIIIIPVFLGLLILYVVRDFLQNKNEIERLKFLRTNPDQSLKFAKIQAYERMLLFLERMNWHALVPRVYSATMDLTTYSQALILTINTEFEHNLTQQLYIPDHVWRYIEIAKNEMIQLIITHTNAQMTLSKDLSLALLQSNMTTLEHAKKLLKDEFKKIQ
jgi:hypothetical protein